VLLLFQEEPDTFLLPHRASPASLKGAVQLVAMDHRGEKPYAANTARNDLSNEKLSVYVLLIYCCIPDILQQTQNIFHIK